MQTVVSACPLAPSSSRPPSCLPVARRSSLEKSVRILASSWRGRRCGVAQASSNHTCWCRPHPICFWFTLAHGRGPHPRQKCIFAAIFAGFFKVHVNNKMFFFNRDLVIWRAHWLMLFHIDVDQALQGIKKLSVWSSCPKTDVISGYDKPGDMGWWWLLLLLSTVVQDPWLRVYVVKIHANLGSLVLDGIEPTILLLLLSTDVQYPWLRVYVVQIHGNLRSRVVYEIEPTIYVYIYIYIHIFHWLMLIISLCEK